MVLSLKKKFVLKPFFREKVELKPNDVFVMYFSPDKIYQILTRDLNIRLNEPGVTPLFYEIYLELLITSLKGIEQAFEPRQFTLLFQKVK